MVFGVVGGVTTNGRFLIPNWRASISDFCFIYDSHARAVERFANTQ